MKYKLDHRMSSCRIIILFLSIIAGQKSNSQISITMLPFTPAVTNFDAYNPNSAANLAATIPPGWTAASSLTPSYRGQGNGTSNAGGYWGYGSGGEFSLGALRSGTPGNITYTLSFVNNSGMTISSLTLAWDYEQWRYANISGWNCTGTGALASNATLNAKDFVGSSTGTSGTVSVTPITSFTLSGLSITDGTAFGISWVTTDDGNADNGVSIDNFNLSACCGGLPVTWLSFDASHYDEQTSQIEWTTTEEINNAYFEIQRSNDGGRHFITIGKVNATLNQQSINVYQFQDRNASPGNNFYRLKQVDLDGNFDFSPVRSVVFKSTEINLNVWPNPSSSNVHIRISNADEKGEIIIVNMIGQKVFEENFGDDGSEQEVEVANLQPGMYTLIVLSGNTRQQERIIIIDK